VFVYKYPPLLMSGYVVNIVVLRMALLVCILKKEAPIFWKKLSKTHRPRLFWTKSCFSMG